MSSDKIHSYTFDVQTEIYAILDKEKFPYDKCPIEKKNTEFDSKLLEKIEKEMIRLEFIESQQKSSAS